MGKKFLTVLAAMASSVLMAENAYFLVPANLTLINIGKDIVRYVSDDSLVLACYNNKESEFSGIEFYNPKRNKWYRLSAEQWTDGNIVGGNDRTIVIASDSSSTITAELIENAKWANNLILADGRYTHEVVSALDSVLDFDKDLWEILEAKHGIKTYVKQRPSRFDREEATTIEESDPDNVSEMTAGVEIVADIDVAEDVVEVKEVEAVKEAVKEEVKAEAPAVPEVEKPAVKEEAAAKEVEAAKEAVKEEVKAEAPAVPEVEKPAVKEEVAAAVETAAKEVEAAKEAVKEEVKAEAPAVSEVEKPAVKEEAAVAVETAAKEVEAAKEAVKEEVKAEAPAVPEVEKPAVKEEAAVVVNATLPAKVELISSEKVASVENKISTNDVEQVVAPKVSEPEIPVPAIPEEEKISVPVIEEPKADAIVVPEISDLPVTVIEPAPAK